MTLLLGLFGVGLVFELLLQLPGILWKSRKLLITMALAATAFASGVLLLWNFNVWTVLLCVASMYRIVNYLRIIEGRMHEQYLRHATLRTTLVMVGIQLSLAALWWGWQQWHETGHLVWLAVAVTQLVLAVILLVSTMRSVQRTKWPQRTPHLSDDDLPTLTVAIPARDETDDLRACLESVITSDYPKLEILVLDDCSQTRRTPEIIRQFAHDGVRFIESEAHKLTWQPKNQAYDHLLREASGEYVLFCGVDVRFAPDSLRQVMRVMLHKRKKMLSLLPWRAVGAERSFAVVQAMRYLWELAPPRRLFNRPPVLSTCWVAKRDALARAGGFVAVARAIVPEAHFARAFTRQDDAYSFMRGNLALGIQSTKPASEQYNTAIRVRYPQLHKRPENVYLLSLVYSFFILTPFVLSVAGFWVSIGTTAHIIAVLATVLNVVVYLWIAMITRTGGPWLSVIGLPYGVFRDLVLLHTSMWKYEFSEVDWKGRNVCIPAMHVYSHLPKV